jgi:hypothetical protein
MPFTISHAAAVLPLRKLGGSRLPLAAMMIGSMSPDFAYFLPFDLGRMSTHEFDGILMFCWPVGLALWLLFVHLVERPTIELLPEEWRARVPRSDAVPSLRMYALASIAIVLGAMTHVAWDAFTHANTTITNAFPAFRAEVFTFHGRKIRVFLILQYLSSVIGLLGLAIWARNVRRSTPDPRRLAEPRSPITDRMRIGAALMVIATSGASALLGYVNNSALRFEGRLFHLLVGGMTGWALAWCAVALVVSQWVRVARRG